jgi:acetoacetate decarboxylase
VNVDDFVNRAFATPLTSPASLPIDEPVVAYAFIHLA